MTRVKSFSNSGWSSLNSSSLPFLRIPSLYLLKRKPYQHGELLIFLVSLMICNLQIVGHARYPLKRKLKINILQQIVASISEMLIFLSMINIRFKLGQEIDFLTFNLVDFFQ